MSIEAIDMILKLWASDPPYEIDGKYWKIHLKKTVDEETGIGYIHKPLSEAASADRHSRHEPRFVQHEVRRARWGSARFATA